MKSKLELVMRKFLIPLLLAGAMVPAAALAQDSGTSGALVPQVSATVKVAASATVHPMIVRHVPSEWNIPAASRAHARTVPIGQPESIATNRLIASRKSNGQFKSDLSNALPRLSGSSGQSGLPPVETTVPPTAPVQQVGSAPPTGNDIVDGLRVMAREQELRRDTHRDQDSGWSGNRDGDHNHHWSGDWRRDHRYDWHHHRSHHGSLFRLGRYFDPYGWGYRHFSIGYSLWPSYYGSSFWLNDPWQYRLPPAYGPYRWVRYYNDALLVNIYTGQVVDVIYSFFW